MPGFLTGTKNFYGNFIPWTRGNNLSIAYSLFWFRLHPKCFQLFRHVISQNLLSVNKDTCNGHLRSRKSYISVKASQKQFQSKLGDTVIMLLPSLHKSVGDFLAATMVKLFRGKNEIDHHKKPRLVLLTIKVFALWRDKTYWTRNLYCQKFQPKFLFCDIFGAITA